MNDEVAALLEVSRLAQLANRARLQRREAEARTEDKAIGKLQRTMA